MDCRRILQPESWGLISIDEEDVKMVLSRTFGPLSKRVFRMAFISLMLLTLMPGLMAADLSDDELAPAFDPANMDRSIPPGDDFYQYVNGGWMEKNPVPSDKTRYNEIKIVEDRTSTGSKACAARLR